MTSTDPVVNNEGPTNWTLPSQVSSPLDGGAQGMAKRELDDAGDPAVSSSFGPRRELCFGSNARRTLPALGATFGMLREWRRNECRSTGTSS